MASDSGASASAAWGIGEPWEAEDQGASDSDRELPTVYDVVAGTYLILRSRVWKVSNTYFAERKTPYKELRRLKKQKSVSKAKSSKAIIRPDEHLFGLKGALQRYQEYDYYYAHERDFPENGAASLPESDLLKAIHGYTSHFYHRTGMGEMNLALQGKPHRKAHSMPQRNFNTKSMDGTALLAFGILVEEAANEFLGQTGDLAFTEGEEVAPTALQGGDDTYQSESFGGKTAQIPRFAKVGDGDMNQKWWQAGRHGNTGASKRRRVGTQTRTRGSEAPSEP